MTVLNPTKMAFHEFFPGLNESLVKIDASPVEEQNASQLSLLALASTEPRLPRSRHSARVLRSANGMAYENDCNWHAVTQSGGVR